jgi:glycine cleavage system regulatory protein
MVFTFGISFALPVGASFQAFEEAFTELSGSIQGEGLSSTKE